MTMKGKEKKQEGRVTRSKSPARGHSTPTREPPSPPASTSGKQRSRSRSRSRSPARTPAKAVASKAEPAVRASRKSEPVPSTKLETEVVKTTKVVNTESPVIKTSRKVEVFSEERLTRSVSRTSATAGLQVLTQRKNERTEESKVEEVKKEEEKVHSVKQPVSLCRLCAFKPFLEQLISVIFLAAMIFVVSAANLMCSLAKCDIKQLPELPRSLTSYFDKSAILIIIGWIILQLALATLPFGWKRTGSLLPDGTRISFRCNGLFALFTTLASLGTLFYLKLPVFATCQKLFNPLLFTTIGLSVAVSIVFYIRARRLPANKLSSFSRTGLVAFLMGREVQPRVGPLNIKIFCLIHMAVLGWAALLTVATFEAYQTGKGNAAFFTVAVLQFAYILDIILFEASLSNSLLITHDCVGFVFLFKTFIWVPFIHSLPLRYLLHNAQPISIPLQSVVIVLFVAGYFIARIANFTKDKFRQQELTVTADQIIPTSSSKPLLAYGLWGWCRHPNYFGCLLMAVAWSLPCGLYSPVTYAYIAYVVTVFVLRARQDAIVCQQKHGAVAWSHYCQRVRSRIIPLIY